MAQSFGSKFGGHKVQDRRENQGLYTTHLSAVIPENWATEIAAHLDLEQLTLSEFLRRAIQNELDRLRV